MLVQFVETNRTTIAANHSSKLAILFLSTLSQTWGKYHYRLQKFSYKRSLAKSRNARPDLQLRLKSI